MSNARGPRRRGDEVAALRAFDRFYTARIGALHAGLLDSRFTLAEVRVLYEIAHRPRPTAAVLAAALGLDPGYLSRLTGRLARRGLIVRRRSRRDARAWGLSLSARGRRAFATLDARADVAAGRRLAQLGSDARRRLVGAMDTIRGAWADAGEPLRLRRHRAGDLGWILERHARLYAEEHGWDHRFEALVAGVIAAFLARADREREACWIAERGGVRLGSVMLVGSSRRIAQLRLLLVEPSARGLGIGARLVDACTAFARRAGYARVRLWTNDVLASARRIYQAAGYRLVDQAPHRRFGDGLIGQTWELTLR